MNFRTIYDLVKETHPQAGEGYVKILLNRALEEIAQYRPLVKTATWNLVEDKRWYPIGDHNSDLRVKKIVWVGINDDEGVIRQIPRLLDGDLLTNKDLE